MLTAAEKKLILHALQVVRVTGGGSEIHSLVMKLDSEWDVETDYKLLRGMSATVVTEAVESLLDGDTSQPVSALLSQL